MNSYPVELLAQLCPVMFVAGLDVHEPQNVAEDSLNPFSLLAIRLREALTTRNQAVFQPKHPVPFQVHLVDKYVRFPPRKLVSQDDPQYSAAHSPLSPLTPTSPLFPDGLIAPIWIRKHTTLLPSVFVLFLRLFELPPATQRSPLDHPDPEHDRGRAEEERRKDAELAAEIALRKKSTNERGIKLTAVLMASRHDQTLDARLTFIRRQSGLDSRAALFVLSPVSQSELGEFVQSLQQALYEPAIEYYTAHSKRVRRKRNRHAQTATHVPLPLSPHGAVPPARPLRPEGWTVRYEYKMACFAEFRGEVEVALKHFQDAYATLVEMFSSTAVLPPRTKRWAEAKVLADCINVKISKLYLYNNEHALALAHHGTHMHRFADLSRGWGIGEETFEYWSWMARQHRVFAELLEQGTRSTLVIPTHVPPPPQLPSVTQASLAGPKPEGSSVMNASRALQHPGYYYYMAARCTELRRERFLAALEAQVHAAQMAPGFMNEKKVDHLTVILELYTKSYELFKQYSPVNAQNQTQSRLTLWIAYRIAQTYYAAGKHDMAIRFFERIAKTYRRERWSHMLRPLLSSWYACAQKIGDVELGIRLLVEMLSHGAQDGEDPSTIEEDLLAVLTSTVPAHPEPLIVDLSEAKPLFEATVVFWSPEIVVNECGPFQVSLIAPENVAMSMLPITSLELVLSGEERSIRVMHTEDAGLVGSELQSVRKVELGHVDLQEGGEGVEIKNVKAYLRWRPGDAVVFCGTILSHVPCSLTISKLVLTLKENSWVVEIPFDSSGICAGVHLPRWLSRLEPVQFTPVRDADVSILRVRHRPHRVAVELTHHPPSYLDEEYPISIDVTNIDTCALEIFVDILLQPTEIDHAVNSIVLDDDRSTGLIRGVSLGKIQPGVNVIKTLYLQSTGAPGDRMVDISIRSARTDIERENTATAMENEGADVSETLRTLIIQTVEPVKMLYNVVYRRSLSTQGSLAHLQAFDSEYWDDEEGGEAVIDARVQCVGPWKIWVESVRLIKEDGPQARIIENFLENTGESVFPAEYESGDEFCDVCRISLAPKAGQNITQKPITGPGAYEIIWRKITVNDKPGPLVTSHFRLPSFRPPTDGIIALLSVPPTAKLHTPISMHLTIRNHHPTRSANVTVQLEPDPTDGFVVAGMRGGRVPILLPGAEEWLIWRLIPLECGHVAVPRLKVVDRRKAIASAQAGGATDSELDTQGDAVKVVDVRRDERDEVGGAVGPAGQLDIGRGWCTILVLP